MNSGSLADCTLDGEACTAHTTSSPFEHGHERGSIRGRRALPLAPPAAAPAAGVAAARLAAQIAARSVVRGDVAIPEQVGLAWHVKVLPSIQFHGPQVHQTHVVWWRCRVLVACAWMSAASSQSWYAHGLRYGLCIGWSAEGADHPCCGLLDIP